MNFVCVFRQKRHGLFSTCLFNRATHCTQARYMLRLRSSPSTPSTNLTFRSCSRPNGPMEGHWRKHYLLDESKKCLAKAKRPCDCSVLLCLRPKSSRWSCPHTIFRHDVIRQRCRDSLVARRLMQQRGPLNRGMVILQLCCLKFSHRETL